MPWEFSELNGWNVDHSPAFWMFETITRMFSPYQFNPFNFN
jgi:NTE family protein